MHMTISKERPQDIEAISRLTEAAFRNEEYSSHTEHFIVNALRRTGQLSISLVAAEHDEILGHVAISPVSISSGVTGWYGLGPISVRPDRQGKGIGSALMWAALQQLRQQGAAGCVVLGDPAYYGRFGFKAHPGLELPDVPPEYFQALSFTGELPVGVVKYAAAFDARE
ncbi:MULTISPECIES: N-acetyltransferase [Pseudomonas]|uniref:N-acetyltransferase n=1 Tax=Pseudomonas fragi TaxID=296 RepID=A0ABT4WV60_PSEFR|nr:MULTISPECIES: N-acetyltransferase [Pseudomonas]MCH4885604.1 N-acetyltransferase [Pseudomonas sp. TMW22080]MDA7023941.1 N-acetyltransferase [Pseudomonas fragi]PAA02598.1 GNAT family N-acetyltransferase [Pseudomonas fragi]PAA40610.1 GNAT family N-acetyltransferase [Pseudomonas fragi]